MKGSPNIEADNVHWESRSDGFQMSVAKARILRLLANVTASNEVDDRSPHVVPVKVSRSGEESLVASKMSAHQTIRVNFVQNGEDEIRRNTEQVSRGKTEAALRVWLIAAKQKSVGRESIKFPTWCKPESGSESATSETKVDCIQSRSTQ